MKPQDFDFNSSLTLCQYAQHQYAYFYTVLYTFRGSISVSGQLPTDPSPNPTLTLIFYQ